jgi:hypothetical protein
MTMQIDRFAFGLDEDLAGRARAWPFFLFSLGDGELLL